ncbi:MAG: Hpt domain-containing protein, partial [Gammaproteobacteria bacterium]
AAKLYHFTTPLETRSPIIILTANATTEAKRECEEANIDAYLTKPIVASKLISTINTICSDASNQTHNSKVNTLLNDSIEKTHIDNEDILDFNVLNSVKELSGDRNFINELIEVFREDGKKLLVDMESAVARKDYESYLESIHALKGSAGSIGAQKLFSFSRQTLLQETSMRNFIDNLKMVKILFQQTEDALSRYTEDGTASTATGGSA